MISRNGLVIKMFSSNCFSFDFTRLHTIYNQRNQITYFQYSWYHQSGFPIVGGMMVPSSIICFFFVNLPPLPSKLMPPMECFPLSPSPIKNEAALPKWKTPFQEMIPRKKIINFILCHLQLKVVLFYQQKFANKTVK